MNRVLMLLLVLRMRNAAAPRAAGPEPGALQLARAVVCRRGDRRSPRARPALGALGADDAARTSLQLAELEELAHEHENEWALVQVNLLQGAAGMK